MGKLSRSKSRGSTILRTPFSVEATQFYLLELRKSNLLYLNEIAVVNYLNDCFLYAKVSKEDFKALQEIYDAVQSRKGFGSA